MQGSFKSACPYPHFSSRQQATHQREPAQSPAASGLKFLGLFVFVTFCCKWSLKLVGEGRPVETAPSPMSVGFQGSHNRGNPWSGRLYSAV